MQVTINHIQDVRASLIESDKVAKILANPKADKNLVLMTNAFLENDNLDAKFAEAINGLKGKDGHIAFSEAESKLSDSMPNYKPAKAMTQYDYAEGRISLASTVLHWLIRHNVLEYITKRIKTTDEHGRARYRTQITLLMKVQAKREMLRGIHTEPGIVNQTHLKAKAGGKSLKLNREQRDYLAEVSSQRLRLVKTSHDDLITYFKSTKWYDEALNGKHSQEDSANLHERIEGYAKAIVELQQEPVLYLSAFFDTRYRLYYDIGLPGIMPHADTFETSQWELAEPELINEAGKRQIIHSIVSIATGSRIGVKEANDIFNHKVHVDMCLKNFKKLGDKLYNKRLVEAYNNALSKTPSHFLLAKDATTGGLQHNGIGWRSTKSMVSSNVGGASTPQDAHQDFADAFGFASRQDAKDVNTPLLHGSSLKTIADIVTAKTGTEQSIEDIIKHMKEAYGPEVMNIPATAQLGADLVNNQVSTLMFNTIDGWKAQSTAYIQSAKMKVYYLNPDNDRGYGETTVQRDMPYYQMKDGSVFEGTMAGSKKTKVKTKGLSANITHTVDGYCLRQVKASLYKHDNFLMHANYMDDAEAAYKGALVEAYDYSAYETAFRDIGTQLPEYKTMVEDFIKSLTFGEATKEMIEASHHFLSA